MNALRNLEKNINNWSFSVYPKMGIDKNEAKAIVEDLQNIKSKICSDYCKCPGECKECPLETI